MKRTGILIQDQKAYEPPNVSLKQEKYIPGCIYQRF
jgi:hypothetical protein